MGSYYWDEPTSYLFFSPTDENVFLQTGAEVYLSRDGGTSYQKIGEYDGKASVVGVTVEPLRGSAATLVGMWDDKHSVDVSFFGSYVPETRTKSEVLAGGVNRLAVTGWAGTEVIAFATATVVLQDGLVTVYRLSNLLRGLRDTAAMIPKHFAGEQVLLLDPDRVFPINWKMADVAKSTDGGATYETITYRVKTAPRGKDPADYPYAEIQPNRQVLRPFAPANITADIQSNGDVEINWDYVTRDPDVRILGSEAPRFLEKKAAPSDTYTFRLEIYQSAVLIRAVDPVNVVAGDSPLYDYTAALQASDSFSNSAEFTLKVNCVSELWDGAAVQGEATFNSKDQS